MDIYSPKSWKSGNQTYSRRYGIRELKSAVGPVLSPYCQLLDEVELRNNGQPQRRHIANLYDRIAVRDLDEREYDLLTTFIGNFVFEKVTQRLLYAQLLRLH